MNINDFPKLIRPILIYSILIAYVAWFCFQLYFLWQFGALSYFSLTSTLVDGWLFLLYFTSYFTIPWFLISFSKWHYDPNFNQKGNQKNVTSFFWLYLSFSLILFSTILTAVPKFNSGNYTHPDILLAILNSIIVLSLTMLLTFLSDSTYKHWIFICKERNAPLIVEFILTIIWLVNIFIVPNIITFDFSIYNTPINIMLAAIALYPFHYRYKFISLSFEDKPTSIQKEIPEEGKKILSYVITIIICLIISLPYIWHFTQFIVSEYWTNSSVILWDWSKHSISYKNDKFVIISWSLEYNIYPIEKIQYYKIQKTKRTTTLDNYINRRQKKFRLYYQWWFMENLE